jgi:hypothetical protein
MALNGVAHQIFELFQPKEKYHYDGITSDSTDTKPFSHYLVAAGISGVPPGRNYGVTVGNGLIFATH